MNDITLIEMEDYSRKRKIRKLTFEVMTCGLLWNNLISK